MPLAPFRALRARKSENPSIETPLRESETPLYLVLGRQKGLGRCLMHSWPYKYSSLLKYYWFRIKAAIKLSVVICIFHSTSIGYKIWFVYLLFNLIELHDLVIVEFSNSCQCPFAFKLVWIRLRVSIVSCFCELRNKFFWCIIIGQVFSFF